MNVVFIGASHFGQQCLEALLKLSEVNVVGAVSAPPSFSISYSKNKVKNVLHSDVSEICREHDVPIEFISDGMRGEVLLDKVKSWKPDIFLVSGWYHMVPKSWRDVAPAYGLHASLLPDYSGGAPLVWAIINGEKETGITLFQFNDGVDDGPIVGQEKTKIKYEDTIATLYARIEKIGLKLINKHIPELAMGKAEHKVQDESKRRLMPQRKPEDGLINCVDSAQNIYNFIRAQTKPYPGAFLQFKGHKVTIWSAQITKKEASGEKTELLFHDGRGLYLAADDGVNLEILSLAVDDEDIEVQSFISQFMNA